MILLKNTSLDYLLAVKMLEIWFIAILCLWVHMVQGETKQSIKLIIINEFIINLFAGVLTCSCLWKSKEIFRVTIFLWFILVNWKIICLF